MAPCLAPLPENRLALAGIRCIAAGVGGEKAVQQAANSLFLHGPAGTGKSLLVQALIDEVTQQAPGLMVRLLSAGDLLMDGDGDLLVIEDLQRLPAARAEGLVQLFDRRRACQQSMVFTATVGPGELDLPARLRSRLASGLVVGVQPFSAESRLALLQARAEDRRLRVSRDILTWLAEHLSGGGRQLDGTLNQLEFLARRNPGPLDVETVAAHFRDQADASRLTVERIAERVSGHFRVEPRRLRSRRRQRGALWPRQVGMYLARQLTSLSLAEIGHYFGGRDHSTVLHACRKVERALASDVGLSGSVRQLYAELT